MYAFAVLLVGVAYFVSNTVSASPPYEEVGCGAITIAVGVNCMAGEPVYMDCDSTQMGYQQVTATRRSCPTNGWSTDQNWGYCESDSRCSAPAAVACTVSNACGQSNTGTVQGDGSCSASAPANPAGYGTACTSAANSCGMTNTGTIQCSGACSASAPANSLCPYAESAYAPGYNQSGYYSESTYAPSYSESTYAPTGCGTPSASLTAAPTRVRSGQTSTLTLTATGVTTSCTITGPGVNTTVPASSCGVSTTLITPAITSQVTYKVTCDSSVDISKIIVNLVPKVIEF